MNLNSTSGTSGTSTNRITGLATGLDVDTLVKSSMKGYQTKVDKQIQSKEVLEIKQKLYRDIMTDANNLYSKYFDVSKSDSILFARNYSSASFTSDNSGVATAIGVAGAKVDNYTVKVTQLASGANTKLNTTDLEQLKSTGNTVLNITYGSKTVNVDVSAATDNESLAKIINNSVSGINMKATYSQFSKGVVIETKNTGVSEDFKIEAGKMGVDAGGKPIFNANTAGIAYTVNKGTDLYATITNGKNQPITYDASNPQSGNTVTIDGVEFSFHTVSKLTAGVYEETTLTGKSDVSGIKDKIVNFVKDYNTYIEKMNKLLNDKRDRSYVPLTADQKKSMSQDEIKLWNEKVENGQLRRDTDITRITNSLRNSAIDPVEGTNLCLEDIGITPSKDYGGNKIGTFTLNEAKLTQALQDDPEGVMDLLISRPDNASKLSSSDKFNKSGIFYRMKDIVNEEFVTSASPLSKKAGLTNSSTFTNNDLTTSISKYETKIKEMQRDLTRREQTLYTKFANLETAMNKYNAQQSSLTSQLGGGQ